MENCAPTFFDNSHNPLIIICLFILMKNKIIAAFLSIIIRGNHPLLNLCFFWPTVPHLHDIMSFIAYNFDTPNRGSIRSWTKN